MLPVAWAGSAAISTALLSGLALGVLTLERPGSDVQGLARSLVYTGFVVAAVLGLIRLGAWLTLLAWVSRACRQMTMWVPLRWGLGWTIAGWLIPVLNLVVPALVTDELWRASQPRRSDRPVLAWWGIWTAGRLLHGMTWGLLLAAGLSDLDAGVWILAPLTAHLLGTVATTVAGRYLAHAVGDVTPNELETDGRGPVRQRQLVTAAAGALVATAALAMVPAGIGASVVTTSADMPAPVPRTPASERADVVAGSGLAQQTFDRTREVGSGTWRLEIATPGSRPDTEHTGRVRFAGDDMALTVDEVVLGYSATAVVRDREGWYRPPPGSSQPPGRPWIRCGPVSAAPTSSYCQIPGSRVDEADPAGLLRKLGPAVTVTAAREESWAGAPATHYTLDIDWSAAARDRANDAAFRQRADLAAQRGERFVEMWVDGTGLPLRWYADELAVTTYGGWGTPVAVDAPSPALTAAPR
ncbi:DUF4328 domain-containing protein [Pseudonocardia alni]|uniref:DUF4328 domain-containing protein n=1 Tax=Pseudonocardia alni TaxID=33907 RepID=UPI00280BCB63|nr:DUF4328 domain-containing protein [Pseudonocardia alni]